MSLYVLSMMLSILTIQNHAQDNDYVQPDECGNFIKNPARCKHARTTTCDSKSEAYNTERCKLARYCCRDEIDLDAGTCADIPDLAPAYPYCAITAHSCRSSDPNDVYVNNEVRRLLQYKVEEDTGCVCTFDTEGNPFCALDVGPLACSNDLKECRSTQDCKPGYGCVKCKICGSRPVCFPQCNEELITAYLTAEQTTSSPTSSSPTTSSPTTSEPTTSSPTTDEPTTAEPTTYDPTASPTTDPTPDPTAYPTPDPTAYPTADPTTPYPTKDEYECGYYKKNPTRCVVRKNMYCTEGPDYSGSSCKHVKYCCRDHETTR